MNDVAAPLFRFFLTDAQTAAREGDRARMHECLALALDFAPEGQRERVLLAASELLPAVGAGAPPSPIAARPLVVKLAEPSTVRRPGRIAWEDQVPAAPTFSLPSQPAETPADRLRGRRWVSLAAAVAVGATASTLATGLGLSVPRRDASARAASAVRGGDGARALNVLAPLGAGAPAGVWLLRGQAHAALGDTSTAVQALVMAAARDSDGGHVALEAAGALARFGAVQEAADASLYAVTPERSAAELEGVAVLQERAGHVERARRVRMLWTGRREW